MFDRMDFDNNHRQQTQYPATKNIQAKLEIVSVNNRPVAGVPHMTEGVLRIAFAAH